jgi:GNAT superfamily N-acetyltransferase
VSAFHREGAVPLTSDQVDEATDVIVRAFVTEPSVPVAFPDPSTRAEACRLVYRMLTRLALKHGEVYVTPGALRAVVIWTPPGALESSASEIAEAGMGDIRDLLSPEGWVAMVAFIEQLNSVRERIAPGPHWHLDFLATDPPYQGRGLGGALLEGVHARADRDGMACALETLTPSNVPFYERRGYRVVETVELPGTEHSIWGMRREPAAI